MSGGGGGSQVIGHWYRLGVQLALAHSPIDKITQLIVGERTAWYGSVDSNGHIDIDRLDLFGGEGREGGVKGRVHVCMGADDQDVNEYIKLVRGETSAQRGLCTLVFGDVGQADKTNLKIIDFNASLLNPMIEQQYWYQNINPKGVLTQDGVEMTRNQAETFIGSFYRWQQGSGGGISGVNGQSSNELEASFKIFGSWRAVCLMYLYRAVVVRNLNITRYIPAYAKEDFFSLLVENPDVRASLTKPFYWAAMNPYFKAPWLRVQSIFKNWTLNKKYQAWYPQKAAIEGTPHRMDNGEYLDVLDMNPAHIIYNILTNKTWGMGYPEEDMDNESFQKAADQLHAEKFGLSLAWRREEVIEEFINIILKTIDAMLRINVVTGKFQLVLIRGGYKLADLPVLNESNIMTMERFERSLWGDTPNEVVLTYRDRLEEKATVAVQNIAAIETQGSVISTTVEYVGIHEPELASRVAQRELNMASTPLAKVSLTVNRMAFLLQVGDLFNFQWEALGITNLALRVVNINKGTYEDGTIQIEAVEDVFGMPESTYITNQDSLWVDPVLTPIPVVNGRVWEAPYYDIVNVIGEAAIKQQDLKGVAYTRAFVDAPSHSVSTYNLMAATVNELDKYTEVARTQLFTPNFTLLESINRLSTNFAISEVENIPREIPANAYVVIGDEIMQIVKLDRQSGRLQVQRGCLDTHPVPHDVYSIGWLSDPSKGIDQTIRALGETVYHRPLPSTTRATLPINQQPPFKAVMVSRAYRPAPPCVVTINHQYHPDTHNKTRNIMLNWQHRNRTIAAFQPWYSSGVTPEDGVKYNVRVYQVNGDSDKLVYEKKDIEGTDHTLIPSPVMKKPDMPMSSGSTLLFHLDFAEHTDGEFTSIKGNIQGFKAVTLNADTHEPVTNPVVIDGAIAESKAFRFTHPNYLKLSFDPRMVDEADVVLGFRINGDTLVNSTAPIFTISKNEGSYYSEWFNVEASYRTVRAWFGNRHNGTAVRTQFEIASGWHDVVIGLYHRDPWGAGRLFVIVDGEMVVNEKRLSWNLTNPLTLPTMNAGNAMVTLGYSPVLGRHATGLEMGEFFMYSSGIQETPLRNIYEAMVVREWPTNMRIELDSVREGIANYQTWRHNMTTS